MKRAVAFVTGKGGLGKSTLARQFTDAARRAGRRVAAWDLDAGTGSMAIFYADRNAVAGCATENVRDPKAPGAWLDSLHGDADDVVLDVPGGAMDDLLRFIGGASHLVDEIKSSGRELVIVSIVGTERDATMAPQVAIDTFGSAVHHVVVKNGRFAAEDQFLIFDGFVDPETNEFCYGKTAEMVREIGGEVVYVPKLNEDAIRILDLKKLTFAEGAVAALRIGRRWSGLVRYWMKDLEDAFSGTWLSANGEVGASASGGKKPVKRRSESSANGEQLAAV